MSRFKRGAGLLHTGWRDIARGRRKAFGNRRPVAFFDPVMGGDRQELRRQLRGTRKMITVEATFELRDLIESCRIGDAHSKPLA